MPGVVVTTATKAGPAGQTQAPSGQAFFVGLMERGSATDAVLVRGMADVERSLGGRPTFGALYDQLKVYFEEGGRQAYVARVVGTGATLGTLTLQDRNTTPASTLKVDAANPGEWSSRLKVEVQNGNAANTFRLIVTLDGDVVEDVNNIATPADAVVKFTSSPYIKVTNLGSASAAPNNNPAVLTATALSAGSDQRGSVSVTDYIAALSRFKQSFGDGAVAIPGQTGSQIFTGLINHCKDNRRVAILADVQSASISDLKSSAASINSEYAGLFAPWVVVSDGGFGTRTISPEGFVMACRARAHAQIGPWRAPGGQMGKANTLLNLAADYTTAQGNDLDSAKVSAIRKVANSIRLYGWRSLSFDEQNYALLKDRDLLNRLVVEAENRLEAYVFESIDGRGQLLSAVNAELVGMVDPIRAAGGLYEKYDDENNLIDPGYRVETGQELNDAFTSANNEIRARLSVRISPTASLITLSIVKAAVTAGL